MNTKRTYRMGARAQAVEATRQRIIQTLFDLSRERIFPDISLDDVAQGAGVSVQTVLRQFGSRAKLIDATTEYAIATVTDERATPIGDVDAAMRIILDHYELRGDSALLILAQEDTDPQVGAITQRGRSMHREWVNTVFAPYTEPDSPLIDLLVVATDVYTWKLLRRDRGLSRADTEQRITHLVTALLPATTEEGTAP